MSDLGHGTETSLRELMDNINLGTVINMWESSINLQSDLGKFQEWAGRNFVKFDKSGCEVLKLGWS